MNSKTTLQLLEFILESTALIQKRTKTITNADDFLKDDENIMRYESILMRLQATGEALKNLHKRDKAFLYLVADETYWSAIIRFREIVSHHYIDIQAEEVFSICKNHIQILEEKIQQLKERLCD